MGESDEIQVLSQSECSVVRLRRQDMTTYERIGCFEVQLFPQELDDSLEAVECSDAEVIVLAIPIDGRRAWLSVKDADTSHD